MLSEGGDDFYERARQRRGRGGVRSLKARMRRPSPQSCGRSVGRWPAALSGAAPRRLSEARTLPASELRPASGRQRPTAALTPLARTHADVARTAALSNVCTALPCPACPVFFPGKAGAFRRSRCRRRRHSQRQGSFATGPRCSDRCLPARRCTERGRTGRGGATDGRGRQQRGGGDYGRYEAAAELKSN